jgi:hypothetical protein
MSQQSLRITTAMAAGMLLLAAFGCTNGPGTNSNSTATPGPTANANTAATASENANASAPPSAASTAPIPNREPERYTMKMVISGQMSVDNRAGSGQWEIDFARLDAQRRWAIKLPAINQEIIYLERPGLKYIILPSRSQYIEVTPEALGFSLGTMLTPAAIIERLSTRPHEQLGNESVNGRPALKYKFTGATDTGTRAGTVQADSFVYIDQETGLPLRVDLSAAASGGANMRGLLETRDIHLNPDASLFDVPAGYKKVTTEQLKQALQDLISFVRAVAPYIGQQINPPPTSAPAPATNSNSSATNTNANRK